jgi:hypothetical protein
MRRKATGALRMSLMHTCHPAMIRQRAVVCSPMWAGGSRITSPHQRRGAHACHPYHAAYSPSSHMSVGVTAQLQQSNAGPVLPEPLLQQGSRSTLTPCDMCSAPGRNRNRLQRGEQPVAAGLLLADSSQCAPKHWSASQPCAHSMCIPPMTVITP